LLNELQQCGCGWLRAEGVRKKLEELTAKWKGPPPLPWESAGSLKRPEAIRMEEPTLPLRTGDGVDAEAVPAAATPTREGRIAPGRNDPCPCASGKKYKACCGRPTAKASSSPVGSRAVPERKRCPCGADNPPANSFCNMCGKRLPRVVLATCAKCKRTIPTGVRFCVHCGSKIATS
jgi:hypothetical protein